MTDLLQYINQIDQSVADAEIDVLESLIQSYDKSIMIITEASDDVDLSVFDIFQEGETWDKFKEDTKAPVFGNKGESFIKRLLMIIPRLIQKLVALIRKMFTKNKSFEQKMDKDMEQMKKQAQTVVPEQLSEEQSENLANKINEARASSQAVAQSERDLKSKRDDVMDSIDKRHEQFREYIRDSEKTFRSKADDLHSYTRSINDPISKALDELEKMINEDDGPLITPDMVEKIDKKNPGLVDELLEVLGGSPRKKVKLEDAMVHISGADLFLYDHRYEHFKKGMLNDIGSLSIPFPSIANHCITESGEINIDAVDQLTQNVTEYIKFVNSSIYENLKKTHNEKNDIYIKYGEALSALDTMREAFVDWRSGAKVVINHYNSLIEKLQKYINNTKSELTKQSLQRYDYGIKSYEMKVEELKKIQTLVSSITQLITGYSRYIDQIVNIWNRHSLVLKTAIADFKTDSRLTSVAKHGLKVDIEREEE